MELRKFKDIDDASDFFSYSGMAKEFNSFIDKLKVIEEDMARGSIYTYPRVLKNFIFYWNTLISPTRFLDGIITAVIPPDIEKILTAFMNEVESRQLNTEDIRWDILAKEFLGGF